LLDLLDGRSRGPNWEKEVRIRVSTGGVVAPIIVVDLNGIDLLRERHRSSRRFGVTSCTL
jgi:hypothetical protein